MSSTKLKRYVGFSFGAAGVCGFVLSSVVLAGDVETKFEEMDANGDGRVSPDEHTSWASRMFERMDANRDGKLTATEMSTAHQKAMAGKAPPKGEMTQAEAAAKIKKFDTNGDGVLTADEFDAAAHLMFETMDTDHDSYLSSTELKAGQQKYLHKSSK